MQDKLRSRILNFKPWVWAASIAVAIILCVAGFILLASLKTGKSIVAQTPDIVFIAPPTITPTPEIVYVETPTPIPEAALINGVGIGIYVQITGTDGDGLRLRSSPGTDSSPLFLGMDTEVFQVKDGPRMANDLVWWYLVAPYDETRAGWAAANYLTLVPTEN